MCGRFPDCVSLLKDEKTRAAKKAITSENVWHYAKRYPGFVIRNGDAGRKRGVVSARCGNESRAATQIAGRKPTAVVSQEAGLSCLTNPKVQGIRGARRADSAKERNARAFETLVGYPFRYTLLNHGSQRPLE